MKCQCSQQSDLSLLAPVLKKYASQKGSLITILQQAQEIYGYLPMDVIYCIAEQTGKIVLSSPRFGAVALKEALVKKGLIA